MGRIFAADLDLASEGKTTCRIVEPAAPSPVDHYASITLARCLKQITGAEFPMVDSAPELAAVRCIFVGN